MEMYIWDKYEKDGVSRTLKYWVDVWEDLIANSNKNSYGISFFSPHLILLDIINEIELNSFKNKEVKKFYQRKINDYVEDLNTIKSELHTGFQLIRKEFNSANNLHLKQLCKELVKEFESGQFFKECFSYIKKLLMDPSAGCDNFDIIKQLTEYLIIELVMVGYDLKFIQKIPSYLFSTYHVYGEERVTTTYPHNVKIEDFMINTGQINYKSYSKVLMDKLDGLSISDRLDSLLYYFFKEKDIYTYIFNIEGLTGIGEWFIGDVHFYSPVETTYIKSSIRSEDNLHEEFFHGTRENHYVNAAVQVEVLDIASAKIEAVEKIEKALDLIRCYYSAEVTYEVIAEEYYVVDEQGKNISSSFTVSKKHGWYKWQSSLRMDQLSEDFLSLSNYGLMQTTNFHTDLGSKITQSLRWYRKAEEAPTVEDKILAYWIVIENFMNVPDDILSKLVPTKEKSSKFMLAKEVIASLNTKNVFYRYGWELFDYLGTLTLSFQGDRKLLNLSEEVMKKSGLSIKHGKVHLQSFINELGSIAQEVDREIIKDKITFAKKFYENENHLQKKMIEFWKKNTEDEMLLLYRLRNQIVHNAHYDYTILPFYVEKARVFAGLILRHAIRENYLDSSIDLETLSLKAIIDLQIMIERLQNNDTLDIEQ